MRPPWPAAIAGALAGALCACGGGDEPRTTPAPANARESAPARPLRDVLGATLAELGLEPRTGDRLARELRTNEGLLPGSAEPDAAAGASEEVAGDPAADPSPPAEDLDAGLDPGLVELREGLVGMVQRDYGDLETARGDLAHIGAEVVPVLAAGLRNRTRDPVELRLLGDLAVAVPDARVARELAYLAANHDAAWLRGYCAWLLSQVADAPGADAIVPELLLRLKYEADPDAFVWLCSALAAFGNYSGLVPLFDLAAREAGVSSADAARQQLPLIAEGAAPLPVGSPREPAVLQSAWERGELGRTESPSDGLRGELWLLVADLSGEHFQLRGVDDARYVLSRLGPWAGGQLALALEDDDEYVRLHVAQVLERMGARGGQSFDSLVLALHDPHGAVAGAAAEALVAVAGDARAADARTALAKRLDGDPPYELRVALARALGRLGDEAPLERLRELFASAPASDLRLAAAEGLLRAGAPAEVLSWLAKEMEAPVGDPAGAESLVEDWLAERAASEGAAPGAQALWEAWQAEAPEASLIHTQEQARARRAARAAALREALPELTGT